MTRMVRPAWCTNPRDTPRGFPELSIIINHQALDALLCGLTRVFQSYGSTVAQQESPPEIMWVVAGKVPALGKLISAGLESKWHTGIYAKLF